MTYYAWLLEELWVAWVFFLSLVVVGLYLAYIKAYIKGVRLTQWTGDVYFLISSEDKLWKKDSSVYHSPGLTQKDREGQDFCECNHSFGKQPWKPLPSTSQWGGGLSSAVSLHTAKLPWLLTICAHHLEQATAMRILGAMPSSYKVQFILQ